MQGTSIAKKADGWNEDQVKVIGVKEVRERLAGMLDQSVSWTLKFFKDDRIHGEGKFSWIFDMDEKTIVYPVFQAEAVGLILKFSLSIIPPLNQ